VWEVCLTDEVDRWLDELAVSDPDSHQQAVYAIEALAEGGPNLGRPLVDRIKGSSIHNMKELRPGSAGATEIRILFAFDRGAARCCLSRETSPAVGVSGIGGQSRARSSSTRRI
jgi:hypothetical protein